VNCYIKERSWVAKLAAKKLKAKAVAIVIGKTIHLHNAAREEFLHNERWVRHELKHVRQFQEYGFFVFIVKYLWESIRKGYVNNKFEVEARAAEKDPTIPQGIHIL
jgi:hypothetical protein